jgi:hypothetical protein
MSRGNVTSSNYTFTVCDTKVQQAGLHILSVMVPDSCLIDCTYFSAARFFGHFVDVCYRFYHGLLESLWFVTFGITIGELYGR